MVAKDLSFNPHNQVLNIEGLTLSVLYTQLYQLLISHHLFPAHTWWSAVGIALNLFPAHSWWSECVTAHPL